MANKPSAIARAYTTPLPPQLLTAVQPLPQVEGEIAPSAEGEFHPSTYRWQVVGIFSGDFVRPPPSADHMPGS